MNAKFPFCSTCGLQALSVDAKFWRACGCDVATGEPINKNPINEPLADEETVATHLPKDHLLKQQYRIHEQVGVSFFLVESPSIS